MLILSFLLGDTFWEQFNASVIHKISSGSDVQFNGGRIVNEESSGLIYLINIRRGTQSSFPL